MLQKLKPVATKHCPEAQKMPKTADTNGNCFQISYVAQNIGTTQWNYRRKNKTIRGTHRQLEKTETLHDHHTVTFKTSSVLMIS